MSLKAKFSGFFVSLGSADSSAPVSQRLPSEPVFACVSLCLVNLCSRVFLCICLGFRTCSRNTLEFPTNTAKPRPRPGANNGSLAASQVTILRSSFLSPGVFLHDSWPQECSLPETTVWVVACLCSIFFFFNQKEWDLFFSPVRKTICLSST